MKIKKKVITIKLVTGEVCGYECASLSTITIVDIINDFFKQNILLSETFYGTDCLCDRCPLLSCKAHRGYMGVRNGETIKNPKVTLFEIGIRDGDTINIVPHCPCTYFFRSQVLFITVSPCVLKFKIRNLDGRYFDWAINQVQGPITIKQLFDDLISYKVLPTHSDLKKYYGSDYSKYEVLLHNGTSFSQDCDLTFHEVEFKSGDEIWLGLVPAEFEPDDVNMNLKRIVVTK